jgi:hypothetical protein
MEPQRFNYPKGFLEHVCYLFCLSSLWSLCAIYLHTDIRTCMYVRTYTHYVDPGALGLSKDPHDVEPGRLVC